MIENIDPTETPDDELAGLAPLPPRTGPRIAISPITGDPYVTAPPGAPRVTAEEVKRLLEDFP